MEDPLHEEDFEGFAILGGISDADRRNAGSGRKDFQTQPAASNEEELGEILPMLEKILPGLSQVKLGHDFSQISTDIWFL